MEQAPHFIYCEKIGTSNLGYISVAEAQQNIPFEIKRAYWTYYTPQDVVRGGHAHKELEQVIFAVSGTITFNTENKDGKKETFVLDHPSKGLYLPKLIWRDIHFTHNAVLLCLASGHYKEADYFRSFQEFKDYMVPGRLSLGDFSQDVLQKTFNWLNDPEIKKLTMTPDFTAESQNVWFEGLKENKTYFIKSLVLENQTIGVAGLKQIDQKARTAEYFGYIGEKKFWGKGLSQTILRLITDIARNDLNLKSLYLKVCAENIRAVRAYENFGFRYSAIENNIIKMTFNFDGNHS